MTKTNRWKEQFKNHPIHTTVGNIKTHIKRSVTNTSGQGFPEKRRLSQVIRQIESALKSIDAELVSFNHLDNLNSYLSSSVLPYTENFSNTGDESQLVNANNNMAQPLTELAVLMSLSANADKSKSIDAVNQLVDESHAALKERMSSAEGEISAVEQKNAEALEGIKSLVSECEENRDRILELYQLAAGDSSGAGHNRSADEERRSARIWRLASIGFIITTAFWLLAVIIYTLILKDGYFDWRLYPMTFSLTGVLLGGSAYAARQSSRHRDSEEKARWLALRVAAFEPFVSSLDDEDKNRIRSSVAADIFGGPAKQDDQSDNKTRGEVP